MSQAGTTEIGHMSSHGESADLLQMLVGYQTSQAIHVAATLGLADLLRDGAVTTAELARATNTHQVALYRLMRALASVGILQEHDGRRFALTAVGQFLRTEVAGTQAPLARLIGRSNHWRAWGDLLHAVRTGTTSFDHVHGTGVWTYRKTHPEEQRVFDKAMASGTERFAEAVIDVFDFSHCQHVIDVGGGDGIFISKLLASYPNVHGTIFDQPHVTIRVAGYLEGLGLSNRCEAIGGDFFVSVPEGGDAYLLKWILHDWDDTAAIDILCCCRKAMNPSGRLIVVEHVIGPPNTGPDGKFLDLCMMVMNGGRERTRDEFAGLFAAAGFRLTSVIPTATPLSVIEGEIETN